MNKTLLITRPRHDLITNYLFFWSRYILEKAEDKGFTSLDLSGVKANRKNVESYLAKRNSGLVVLNGHGNRTTIAGDSDSPLISVGINEEILSGKIVYLRSCEAAQVLGQSCIRKGTKSLIGYKEKFWLGYSGNNTTTPLCDVVAKRFLEPSNLVPISLIKGNSVVESYKKSQKLMSKNILSMMSSEAGQNERDSAPYLYSNKLNQVLLGDSDGALY